MTIENKRLKFYLIFPFAVLWYVFLFISEFIIILAVVSMFSFGLVGTIVGGLTAIFPIKIVATDIMPLVMLLGSLSLISLSGIFAILAIKLGRKGGKSLLKFRSFSEDARCTD